MKTEAGKRSVRMRAGTFGREQFVTVRFIWEKRSIQRLAEIPTGRTLPVWVLPARVPFVRIPASERERYLRWSLTKQTLTAQENEPVRITERIPAKELIVTPKGEKLVDFGQNLTGLVELKVHGRKGQKIVIRHAEVLDKDGNFYTETLRQAKSEDTYICNGEEQVFLPHFTFHGFRYICVEGMDDLNLDQFTACVMHSDMEKTGELPLLQ